MAGERRGSSVPAAIAQHDAHEIGGIFGAEFSHDARAMHLDRARTDTELPPGLLIGGSLRDPPEDFALTRGEPLVTRKVARENVVRWLTICQAWIASRTRVTTAAGSNGFSMKSSAPLRIASTAVAMSPRPEMTRIGAG